MTRRKLATCFSVAVLATALSTEALAQFGGFFGPRADPAKELAAASTLAARYPSSLAPFFRALYLQGERNAVLNFKQLGLAAMEVGDLKTASTAFAQATLRIDEVFADDPNARKARSLWHEESAKDFKGEPYERAMAYYYRGLLYAMSGDLGNAAASFRAADYQDTQAEAEEHQGDFGIMLYLAAWANACRGDAASSRDFFAQASTRDPSVANLRPDAPVLLLIDSGRGPEKWMDGKQREVLRFRPVAGGDDGPLKLAAPDLGQPLPAGDLQFQAQTRGGRQIDGILKGKAQFKGDTQALADAASTTGAVLLGAGLGSGDRNLANFGAAASLFGLLAQVTAEAVQTSADTRNWGSLPATLQVAAGSELPSASRIPVSITTGGGRTLNQEVALHRTGECAIGWVRTRSALAPKDGGTAAIEENPTLDDSGRAKRNAAFRASLLTMF